MGNLDEFLPQPSRLRTLPGTGPAIHLQLEEGDKIIGMEPWKITGQGTGFVLATAFGRLFLLKISENGVMQMSGPLEFVPLGLPNEPG